MAAFFRVPFILLRPQPRKPGCPGYTGRGPNLKSIVLQMASRGRATLRGIPRVFLTVSPSPYEVFAHLRAPATDRRVSVALVQRPAERSHINRALSAARKRHGTVNGPLLRKTCHCAPKRPTNTTPWQIQNSPAVPCTDLYSHRHTLHALKPATALPVLRLDCSVKNQTRPWSAVQRGAANKTAPVA